MFTKKSMFSKNLWQNKCVESVKVKYGTCHFKPISRKNINFKEVHCHLFKQIYNPSQLSSLYDLSNLKSTQYIHWIILFNLLLYLSSCKLLKLFCCFTIHIKSFE